MFDKDAATVLADKLFYELWGDDYSRRHINGDMQDTPRRFVDALIALTTQEDKNFEFTTFESDNDEMVVVRDIPFQSMCAHHVLPFVGIAHVGYVPKGRIAGLSKLARAVKLCAAAPHVQEDLTEEIVWLIENNLSPLGVGVVLEAEHMCMSLRGVQTPGTKTVTSKMTGCFADHSKLARQEFLDIVRR